MEFSRYFTGMSSVFSDTYPDISEDSQRIGYLLASSAVYLNGSIAGFSPDYAGQYLAYEREALALMDESYERAGGAGGSKYVSEYRESLGNIRQILLKTWRG